MKTKETVQLDLFKKAIHDKANWLKEYEPEEILIDYQYGTARYIIEDYILKIQGNIHTMDIYSWCLSDEYYENIEVRINNITNDKDKIFRVISKMREIKGLL